MCYNNCDFCGTLLERQKYIRTHYGSEYRRINLMCPTCEEKTGALKIEYDGNGFEIRREEVRKMNLNDIKTLQEISQEHDIPVPTLKTRMTLKSINLIEGIDFRRLGKGQSILFSPEGVRKITAELRENA